jgi:UDP-N-acetylmuramate--alanine ligase
VAIVRERGQVAYFAAGVPVFVHADDDLVGRRVAAAQPMVAKDVSSRDLAADLPPARRAGYAEDHAAVVEGVAREAQPGDTVLIMGARDPDLPALARAVYAALT